MEQNPAWEANSSSSSQEILRTLWNPAVCYPSQINPIHKISPTTWRYALILSFNLRYIFKVVSFPQVSYQNPVRTSPLPFMCYMPLPSHSPSFDHSNNFWWGARIAKLRVHKRQMTLSRLSHCRTLSQTASPWSSLFVNWNILPADKSHGATAVTCLLVSMGVMKTCHESNQKLRRPPLKSPESLLLLFSFRELPPLQSTAPDTFRPLLSIYPLKPLSFIFLRWMSPFYVVVCVYLLCLISCFYLLLTIVPILHCFCPLFYYTQH